MYSTYCMCLKCEDWCVRNTIRSALVVVLLRILLSVTGALELERWSECLGLGAWSVSSCQQTGWWFPHAVIEGFPL